MSKKLKVVHIISGLGQGGAENALYQLLSHQSSSIKSTVISLTGLGVYGKSLNQIGVPVVTLDMPDGQINFSGLVRLWKELRKNKPNIDQTWMYHADLIGGVIARLAGCKHVFWGIVHFNLDRSVTKPSTRFVAKLCALSSAFIPYKIISCAFAAVDIHVSFGYKKNQFVVIPLGYDLSQIEHSPQSKLAIRNSYHIPESQIVVGCVARWHPQKDHRNLFLALNELKNDRQDWVCVLVGPGMTEENGELTSLLEEIGLGEPHILKMGIVENINDAYSAMDLFVLSSCGEAFPNVLAEAMACELPCVATDVGDTNLIIADTGWIVPANNPLSLAAAISEAMMTFGDTQSWKERKSRCRLSIENNFSILKTVRLYEEAWHSSDRLK